MFNRRRDHNPNFDAPWNKIFKVVFFPDRIYHAEYLNATRSPRYQYNVLEVRGRRDFIVLKAEVYLGWRTFSAIRCASNTAAGRLAEQVRSADRLLGNEVLAWVELTTTPAQAETPGSNATSRCSRTPMSTPTRSRSGKRWSRPPRARTRFRCLIRWGCTSRSPRPAASADARRTSA